GGRLVNLDDLAQQTQLRRIDWENSLDEPYAKEIFEKSGDTVSARFDFHASWLDSIRVFEDFCDRLFHRRDPEALIYTVHENGETRQRWLSPEDISFLVAIGLRALVETCWERGIMLLSIAKDSSTQYFSRHYIGVMREIKVFPPVEVGQLPWTDRVLLESIACQV